VNHSIYSADRMTHLKIVVAALNRGDRCGRCWNFSTSGFWRWRRADGTRDKGGQNRDDHEFERKPRPLIV
jgi:hypothetical protein